MASTSNDSNKDCYLIVYNVSKKHNIGTILRCATAFNVKKVCLVGSRDFNTFGSHGSDIYVSYLHFNTLEECCQTLKTQHNCKIIGIEITDDAQPVHSCPWSGNVAFMLGNEGQGMTERQMKCCDSFVYIPQYGVGTASLNVAVACSIVLNQYAIWSGYEERSRTGYKFDVAERRQRTVARGTVPLSEAEIEELREKRRLKRELEAVGNKGGAEEGETQKEMKDSLP